MKNSYHEIIRNICNELNIKCTLLSKDWIIMLEKNGIIKFIVGYKFDLNAHGLGLVLDDKYAMYEVLKLKKINVIKHSIVYGENNKNEYAINCNNINYLENLFYQYDKNVVLKINRGTCGNNVEHITNLNNLKNIYRSMSTDFNSLSLCPYYNIETEYRAIILNNQIKLLYKKEKPIVFGDGKSTIKELLVNFNPIYFQKYDETNQNIILNEKEQYIYDWKFNLSRGAKISKRFSLEEKQIVEELAILTAQSLNLGFCSVDIIKTNDKYYVLEINSGVMMKNYIEQLSDGYDSAYKIYKEAILEMFKEK